MFKRGVMMESPGFSKFRAWMDVWDDYLAEEARDDSINHVIDSQGMVLFFKKDKDYYGAGEDSRVIFARLKNPDEDTSKGWEEEASFTAQNLSKTVRGEPSQHVFSKDDLKKIKIVDREDMIEDLKAAAEKAGTNPAKIRIINLGDFAPHRDRDDAPNFVRADEE